MVETNITRQLNQLPDSNVAGTMKQPTILETEYVEFVLFSEPLVEMPEKQRVFAVERPVKEKEKEYYGKRDGFELIAKDQCNILDLYDNHFCRLNDLRLKKEILEIMIRELCLNASLEEAILYPLLECILPDGAKLAERNYWEHMLNRIHLQKLLEMDYNDKLFVSSVDHMIPYLRQHYETEEKELFPRARQYFDQHQLKALFKILEAAKQVAPTTPRDNHSWLRGKLLQAYEELKRSLTSKKSMP